jgi:hypothetical protein
VLSKQVVSRSFKKKKKKKKGKERKERKKEGGKKKKEKKSKRAGCHRLQQASPLPYSIPAL